MTFLCVGHLQVDINIGKLEIKHFYDKLHHGINF